MTFLFLNIGAYEVALLLILILAIFIGIGNYGRNTQLGYTGSVLLAIFATPLVAFITIWYMRSRMRSPSHN